MAREVLGAGACSAGGVAGLAHAAEPASPWWQQRAGSLRSLNELGVALALRLLEDLASGRVPTSVWLQLEYDDSGLPTLQQRVVAPHSCPLCALCATGDGGWQHLPAAT